MTEHESDILIAEPEEEIFEDTNDSLENNSSNLFEYNTTAKEENKTIEKETETFVNYKNNNLNKVYRNYDVIQTYVPKNQKKVENKPKQSKEFEKFVSEQNSYVPEKETLMVENVQEKQSFRFKKKAKVWLFSLTAIFVMLCGLAIYNGIHIHSMNNQISETTTSINNYNGEIKKVINSIDKLTDEDNILNAADELGLKQVSEENKIEITLKQKNNVEDYKSQTNFFDKICNFFRNLFGG